MDPFDYWMILAALAAVLDHLDLLDLDLLGADGADVLAEGVLAVDELVGPAKARELRPNVALVDLKMPGIDGFKVIEQVRAKDDRIVIVVITGMRQPFAILGLWLCAFAASVTLYEFWRGAMARRSKGDRPSRPRTSGDAPSCCRKPVNLTSGNRSTVSKKSLIRLYQ